MLGQLVVSPSGPTPPTTSPYEPRFPYAPNPNCGPTDGLEQSGLEPRRDSQSASTHDQPSWADVSDELRRCVIRHLHVQSRPYERDLG